SSVLPEISLQQLDEDRTLGSLETQECGNIGGQQDVVWSSQHWTKIYTFWTVPGSHKDFKDIVRGELLTELEKGIQPQEQEDIWTVMVNLHRHFLSVNPAAPLHDTDPDAAAVPDPMVGNPPPSFFPRRPVSPLYAQIGAVPDESHIESEELGRPGTSINDFLVWPPKLKGSRNMKRRNNGRESERKKKELKEIEEKKRKDEREAKKKQQKSVAGEPEGATGKQKKRLWGDHGQQALESSSVCLINASAVGTEVLKSLILPGIGSYTIIDSHKVTPQDTGNK
ncbi:unnamed protein product, partial [Darwinula stevensoni]